MTNSSSQPGDQAPSSKVRPFRRAVLRGLGVVMPPLLTLVLFIWAWATIDSYVLRPIENGIGQVAVFLSMRSGVQNDIPEDTDPKRVWVVDRDNERVATDRVLRMSGHVRGISRVAPSQSWRIASFDYEGTTYVPSPDHKWIPDYVYEEVKQDPGKVILQTATANEFFERFVKIRYLPRWRTIPVFLIVFVSLLYLLGRFLAAGVGRIFVTTVEALINRLPIVRNVYTSVKQVTDFVFSEREIEFNRVVAVQYPRKGIWSVGFVTGESMLDIRSAANESVLSVLMPTSPMPATGFTITVRKSETIDLDITIDQAIQFVVSCGVVVPPQQQQDETSAKISQAIARRLQGEVSAVESPLIPRLSEQRLSKHLPGAEASKNGDGLKEDADESTDAPSSQPSADEP